MNIEELANSLAEQVIKDAEVNVDHDDDHFEVVGKVIQNLTQYLMDTIS